MNEIDNRAIHGEIDTIDKIWQKYSYWDENDLTINRMKHDNFRQAITEYDKGLKIKLKTLLLNLMGMSESSIIDGICNQMFNTKLEEQK